MIKKIIAYSTSFFILSSCFFVLVNSVQAADCSYSCYKGKAYCSDTGLQSTNVSNNESCYDQYEYELENADNAAVRDATNVQAPVIQQPITPTTPTVPSAQTIGGATQSGSGSTAGKSSATGLVFNNPLCPDSNPNCVTPQSFIGRIINAILGVVGSIALLMFIYGGFLWMTSQGNEKKVTDGKNILLWAALGMALIFMSYAIVRFFITDIIGAK